MRRQISIIDKANRNKTKYNILTFNAHERYQTQLAKTGHNFYSFNHEEGKDWYEGHGKMPENCYQLGRNNIPNIVFDMILSHSKFGQYQIAQKINDTLQIPLISLEHTLPIPQWPQETLSQFLSMRGHYNIFITNYSKGKWGMDGDVIEHSVDTNLFKPDDSVDRSKILTVAHDFIKRDYALNYQGWERITKGLDRVVVGETEGLSSQSESVEDLVKSYQNALVYINPSVLSPVPTSMLEAMSCGCAIVTTETCEIPNFIEHGVNGFISNNEEDLRSYCEQLLEDKPLAAKMGAEARKTIEEKFSEQEFITKWNNVFDRAYKGI
jgi:hypothetical protein|tara:strand:+ start:5467 stop:6438 length:972 start_codon:yes stop_codon:yes gene_type:complete